LKKRIEKEMPAFKIKTPPEWGTTPVPESTRKLGGMDYFILWSSLGVGLLVLSAGSLLSDASFFDSVVAIIAGSVGGSLLLALAGKIGSDHGITSLVSMRASLGTGGSYAPAVLNILQLVGWTVFEIMIMARAATLLAGSAIPYSAWAAVFGVLVTLLGIAGPLAVARQWLGKFAVWIAYGTSVIIIISLLASPGAQHVISSPGKGMSFFTALDLVIAMPISWMPLVADYNRFAKKNKGRAAFWATMVGFTLTNILFYFGGVLLGTSDVVAIIVAIQAIFFGFLVLLLVVDEADNAFADVYSAAVSAQDIFSHLRQKHLIVGFTAVSTVLAMVVTIQDYETFLLLIGAVFVPLFGVVLTDYYVVRKQKYTEEMLYGDRRSVRWPAVAAWAAGALLGLMISPLSPIYLPQMPAIGSTVPSLAAASLVYLAIVRLAPRGREALAPKEKEKER
jgi:putative hydroxymethylpyrimidine transporter CytX